jgi:hypothetical protein
VRNGTPPLSVHGSKPINKSKGGNVLLSKLAGKSGAAARAAPNKAGRSKEPPPPAAILGAKESVVLCLIGLLYDRGEQGYLRKVSAQGACLDTFMVSV